MNISIRNLEFEYPRGAKALTGVTLEIGAGERVAIIGQNGAGKTTLAKHLIGLLRPTQGDVEVGGWNTRTRTVAQMARRVGYVFQDPHEQIFKSRVADEVGFGLKNLGITGSEYDERVNVALDKTGLSGLGDVHPYELQPAQRKWVTIASVLVMETAILVLDEPTVGQDAHGLARLGRLVDDWQKQHKTVVAITHDTDFCAEHLERVVVMKQGCVFADGTPHEVFGNADSLGAGLVEAPQITRLGSALGLGTVLRVDEFLTQFTGSVKRNARVRE